MRLTVLNKNFETLGSVPLFRTLLWSRRYEKLGAFELYTSKDYFDLLNQGRFFYRNDASELGVIDEVNYSQDENGSREVYAKGNFAESLLKGRVIYPYANLSGTPEEIMRTLVTNYAISPADPARKIAHLRLGEISGEIAAERIEMQITGDNLSEKLYEIGNTYEMSHRIRYDYLTNDLIFEVWKGKDRRDTQTDNSWAIFSNSFYNIRNAVYNRCDAQYKNFAYVAGAGEGEARTIITVDTRKNTDEERRELWVDARDIQPKDENEGASQDAQYKAQLLQRGKEKLAEYHRIETVESGVDPLANLVYKKDFDLGDYSTYTNTEVNIETEKRITEIMETYEGGAQELSVTFGRSDVTSVQQLIKRGA